MPYFTQAKPNSANEAHVKFGVLTQLISTDFIWLGWGALHVWPAMNNAWRPTLGQTLIFTWLKPKVISAQWHHFDLKSHWPTRPCLLFVWCEQFRFDRIKSNIWLKQGVLNYLCPQSTQNCHLARLLWSTAFDPWSKSDSNKKAF